MNNKVFLDILKIDILYGNPNIASRYLKNKKKYKNIFKNMFLNILLFQPMLMIVSYLLLFFMYDLKQNPEMFNFIYIFFMFLGLSSGFMVTYNIFYNSDDIEIYKYLPIDVTEILKSKTLTILLNIFGHIIPVIPLGILFYLKNNFNIFEIIIYPILIYSASLLFLTGILIAIISLLIKSLFFKKIQKFFIGFMNIFTLILIFGFIFGIQFYSRELSNFSIADKGIFSTIFLNPLYTLLIVCLLSVTGIFLYLKSINEISKTYFKDNNIIRNITNKKHYKNKLSFFTKYHLDLVFKDSATITSALVTSFIFPISFSFSFFRNIDKLREFSLVAIINVALLFAVAQYSNFTNLSSIIISLEKENFNYIKALPINLFNYIIKKLFFSVFISAIFPLVFIFGVFLYFKFNLIHIFIGGILYIIFSLSFSIHSIIFDYKNFRSDWRNVNELFSRVSKIWQFLAILCISVVIIVFVASMIFASIFKNYILIPYFIIAVISLLISYFRMNKFRKSLEK